MIFDHKIRENNSPKGEVSSRRVLASCVSIVFLFNRNKQGSKHQQSTRYLWRDSKVHALANSATYSTSSSQQHNIAMFPGAYTVPKRKVSNFIKKTSLKFFSHLGSLLATTHSPHYCKITVINHDNLYHSLF